MPADLIDIVERLAGRRIVLVGDLILDRYVYGDAERVSPEAPVPVLRVVETRHAVGGCANVAACLRALGCEVAVFGLIGDDRHGRTLRALLDEPGLDATGVIDVPDRPTTTKTRLIGLAQHRHRQQLLRVDREDVSTPDAEVQTRLADSVCRAIASADVVCIEDYDKGVVGASLVRAITVEARAHGRPVIADPARIADFGRYHGVTILTPNREELAHASGRRLDSIDSVGRGASLLAARLELDAVVATVDRDGAVIARHDGRRLHVATRPRSVYDNTGAGDAVLAALAGGIAAGADVESATKLANLAGGLEVEKFGCVPVYARELLAELRLQSRRRNGKLRALPELLAELNLRRDRGETVAFTNGCFDILHAGHVDFLRRSRDEASVLVVGVNTDASVRALGKGRDRPINRFEHRCAVLSAMECVDYVVGFDVPTPEGLIRAIKPDVLIKGADWADKGVVGAEFVEAAGGRVVLVPLVEGLSTTNLIARVRGAGGG